MSLEEQRELLHARVDIDMSLRSPLPEEMAHLDQVRNASRALAHVFVDNCPPSRELSLALTALDESLHWAIAAIVRQQVPQT